MTINVNPRAVRAAVRRGNQMKRLRTELGRLDDQQLCARLGKYLGRTPSDTRHRHLEYFSNRLDRERVIERIVAYELPE